jgi:hypothetical protein
MRWNRATTSSSRHVSSNSLWSDVWDPMHLKISRHVSIAVKAAGAG